MGKTIVVLFLLVGLFLLAPRVLAGERLTPRPGRSGRSVVMAPNGMVATSQPLAASAGVRALDHRTFWRHYDESFIGRNYFRTERLSAACSHSTTSLAAGTSVALTFHWPDADRWEGIDFEVRVE